MSELAFTLPEPLLDEITRRVAALIAADLTSVPTGTEVAPWLDVDGAARHLGYSDLNRGRRRIYDLVSSRQLDPRRDGRRLLFRPEDLDTYIEGNTP
jgi:hypothetical protein